MSYRFVHQSRLNQISRLLRHALLIVRTTHSSSVVLQEETRRSGDENCGSAFESKKILLGGYNIMHLDTFPITWDLNLILNIISLAK